MTPEAPAAPPAPPAPAAPPAPNADARSPRKLAPQPIALNLTRGIETGSDRVLIYGTGGVGKSTLAACLPSPVVIDLERSTKKIDVPRDRAYSWLELRGKVAGFAQSPPEGIRTLVIDSGTVAEQLCCEHVVETRTNENGRKVDSVGKFGWARGWQYVFDEWVALLADLDRVADKGFNVCIVSHDVIAEATNPNGEKYPRYEPNHYGGTAKGQANVRALIKNWAEHVVFLAYDIFVKNERAQGSATRTAYTVEYPAHLAKSRSRELALSFDLSKPTDLWDQLGVS